MKRPIKFILVAAWLTVATIILGRWWYANPDFFPQLPEAVWKWLDKLYGASNVDGASDVEFLVVVFISFCVVSVLTWLAWRLLRHTEKSC